MATAASGVPETELAEWAGHGLNVLLEVYASCIDGQDEAAKRRIELALRDSRLGDAERGQALRTNRFQLLWQVQGSNLRRHKPTDLQSTRAPALTCGNRRNRVGHSTNVAQTPS